MSTVPYTFANDTGNITLSQLDVNFANVKAFADTAGYVTQGNQANVTSVGTLTSLSVSGTITGGSINISTVSITGNVTANNGMFTTIVNVASHTGGLVSVTGNITGANIVGTTVSATGNVVANNVMATTIVNVASHTGAVVSVSGNITGGNIRTAGVVSATGNITVGSGGSIGVGTTTPDTEITILGYPQTVSYSLTGNSTTLGTDLHITGADASNTRITQDAFGTGSYVAFTGRSGRGTAATPTQTQSGDTLAQFTARGFSNGTLQFGNASTGRVDIVAAEAFTDTSRATNVQIYTTATSAIAATAVATFSSAAGLSVAGNVTANNIVANVVATSSSITGNITANNGMFTNIVNVASHTGAVVSVTGNVTANNISATGTSRILSGTAPPAGGTAGAGMTMSSTANLGVFFGTGAPTLTAAKGSLYLNTTATTTTTRLYINTDGAATWTNFTTAA